MALARITSGSFDAPNHDCDQHSASMCGMSNGNPLSAKLLIKMQGERQRNKLITRFNVDDASFTFRIKITGLVHEFSTTRWLV
jgi:hypothetical protein